jgi:hypothetical protein
MTKTIEELKKAMDDAEKVVDDAESNAEYAYALVNMYAARDAHKAALNKEKK